MLSIGQLPFQHVPYIFLANSSPLFNLFHDNKSAFVALSWLLSIPVTLCSIGRTFTILPFLLIIINMGEINSLLEGESVV